jgi:hypothetical protein
MDTNPLSPTLSQENPDHLLLSSLLDHLNHFPLSSFISETSPVSPSSHAMSSCYKCGATDHVATNRNCPRPRRAVVAPAPQKILATPRPASRGEAKFIKTARQGEDTRFWFYTSEDEGQGPSEVKEEGDAGKWVENDGLAGVLQPPEDGKAMESLVTVRGKIRSSEVWGFREDAKESVEVHARDVSPTVEKVVITQDKNNEMKHVPPAKTPSKTKKKSSAPKTPAGISAVSLAGMKSRPRRQTMLALRLKTSLRVDGAQDSTTGRDTVKRESMRRKLNRSMPVLTPKYSAWLDRPENDPFAPQNWEGMEFNYMGGRNTISEPWRVMYGRGVQGWRECRSVGSGLGREFPWSD